MLRALTVTAGLCLFSSALVAHADNKAGIVVPIVGNAMGVEVGSGAAQKGDVIFSQQMLAEKTAKLNAPFFIERDNTYKSRYELGSGALMYRVLFPGQIAGFCSVDHGYSQAQAFGKRWDSQICFIDQDNDGRFDLEYAGATRKFNLSPLSLNILWSEGLDFDSIPYAVSGPDKGAAVEARVELGKITSKKVKFRVSVRTIEGEWSEHGEVSHSIEKGTQFPIDLDIYTAKISVNSIEDGVLAYELVSGFSDELSIRLK